MAHLTLRALLMTDHDGSSNEAMVENLERSGVLRTPECLAAFRAVDRGHFWIDGSGAVAYADMPLRSGKLHQSAPHIYARALEALMPLRPGMSFLNIGSGTGYFSSLVGELVGEESVNDGIDLWPETIAHATERCQQVGKHHIQFTLGNVYQLDVNMGMRYSRIYIGACASSRAKYLYDLLEIGGILVGPFQSGHGHSQQLRRIVRESETSYKVEVLNSVHFASLIEPNPESDVDADVSLMEDGDSRVVGLPGVPFTFALRQQPWSVERSWAYPDAFKHVVASVTYGRPLDLSLPFLPPEIWLKHIFPFCPRWWFEQPHPPPRSRTLSALALASETFKKALLFRSRCRTSSSVSSDGGSTRASISDLADDSLSESSSLSPSPTRHNLDANDEDSGLRVVLLQGDGARDVGPGPRGDRRQGARRFWRCVGRCCTIAPHRDRVWRGLATRCGYLWSFAARCAARST